MRTIVIILLISLTRAYAQELPLYNGAEYTSLYHKTEGHPFFGSDSLFSGEIFYDGILYKNVLMGYNIADNQVYIKEQAKGINIRLVNDKISYFIIDGHRFEKVTEGNSVRFYDITYSNNVKLYTERYKKLISSFRPEDPRKFVEYTNYFVSRNGKLSRIRKPGAIKADIKYDSVVEKNIAVANAPSPLLRKSYEENRLYEIGKENTSENKIQVSLAGYIKDAKTGESIVGATISVDSGGTSVISDQYGFYSVKLSRGKHTISISGAGMNSTRRQLVLNDDGKLDIEMTAQVGSLKTVVVLAEKNSKLQNTRMGVEKLTIKNIRQVPVVFGEADVLRVVTTLPGVTTAGEAGSGYNVRGGSVDQNLILFNEATIYNPSHLFGFFSAFHPDIIKSVELYKSSIPERFGGRLSSVLDVSSREGNNKKIEGTGGIGPLTSKLTIEGPIIKNKTSFIVAGRTTYSNWLLRQLPNEDYRNSRAAFYDVSLNITHSINTKNSIYLTGYMSDDRFRLNNDTTYQYGNKNGNIKWKHIFNNKLYSVITAGYDHYQYSVKSDVNPVNAFKLGFNIDQAHFRTAFSYTPSNRHSLDMGIHSVFYKLQPGSFEPNSGSSAVMPDKLQAEQALETAFYIGDKYTVTPDLSLNLGVRYSFYNYLGAHDIYQYAPGLPKDTTNIIDTLSYAKGKIIKTYHAPEFRISARYSLSDNSSVKIGFNTTRQYIHMLSNTTIVSPTDTWKMSDPDIKPQQGFQVSAGYYRNFKANVFETSVELYFKRMKNVLDYKSGARLVMNHYIAADVIGAKGKSYGAELMIKKTSGKINGWLSYTYSRTFLMQDDSLAGEMINKGEYYPANFDKPHNLNVIANYRFTHRFSLSLNIVYTTGRPITIPVSVFDLGGSPRVYYSERNQFRVPDYFRGDASFTMEGNHKLKQRAHNSWSFGVYNFTARKNPYSVYFRQEGGVIKGYQLSIFGTIIPFVTYNFRF